MTPIFDFATLISVIVIAALAISVCVGMALDVYDDLAEFFRSHAPRRRQQGFPIDPASGDATLPEAGEEIPYASKSTAVEADRGD